MSTINKDYIGIIKNVNGCVKFVKEEIQQKTALVNELKAMAENPNRTIFDLQTRMDMEFIPSERSFINYVSPYSYSDTYVSGASYPKAPTYDEYREELEKEREGYIKKYEDMYVSLKKENLMEFNTRVRENAERDIEAFVKRRKNNFYNACTRFCQAYSYASLLRELKSDPDVKMWSTDTVGWTNLSYSISDDIRIDLHTNFGYGWSSYFYLGLTYKGIDILPFSFFVKYYYADRRDIARYTRLYATEHRSWDYAFDYVETVAHKASEGDESFASEYVMNEVQEMLSRLRNILLDPEAYFETHIASKNPDSVSHYLTVRNMNRHDENTYAVYPHEMIAVFQAEKISGALDFIEKVSALEPIYDQALEAADEIRCLAKRLVPRLEKNIARMAADVKRLQDRYEELSHQIEILEREIKPHDDRIDALLEGRRSKAKDNEIISRSSIESEYSADHPEYMTLANKKREMYRKLVEVGNEKSDRQSFHSKLEQCLEEIGSIE